MQLPENSGPSSGGKTHALRFVAGRTVLAILFVFVGISHFLLPASFSRIIPPILPYPKMLLWVSGIAEMLGGVDLLIPPLRRAAAYGLALLLVAVFPANVYMATAHVAFPGIMGRAWLQWLRLPLQPLLIWWVLQYSKTRYSRAA
jgi:uncharacterized membrane protein